MLTLLSTGLCFAENNLTGQTVYLLNDGDDSLAASKIVSALKLAGETAEKLGKSDTLVLWKTKNAGNYILEPKTSSDSIDRIIVRKFYALKPEYQNSDVMKDLVRQANRKFNLANFSLDDDGDLKVQGYVCFLDNLDLAILDAFCTYLNTTDFIAMKLIDQNFIEYLK